MCVWQQVSHVICNVLCSVCVCARTPWIVSVRSVYMDVNSGRVLVHAALCMGGAEQEASLDTLGILWDDPWGGNQHLLSLNRETETPRVPW